MNRRRRELLTGAALTLGAALLSAFFFVAFLAPGWPRTPWGWLISAALGLPLLVLGEVVIALCFQLGPPRFHRVLRRTPWGVQAFRYPAGSRAAHAALLAVRVLAAAAIFGAVLWLLYAVFFGHGAVRAQFR